jgi:hypothetical protein
MALLSFLVLGSYSISYILYSIQLININGTLEVGKRALKFCGKNIYLIDTGEYKVFEGILKYTTMDKVQDYNFKASRIITNVLLLILYICTIIITVLTYFVHVKPKNNTESADIKSAIILFLGFASIIVTFALFGVLPEPKKNDKYKSYTSQDKIISQVYRFGPVAYIRILTIIIILPFTLIRPGEQIDGNFANQGLYPGVDLNSKMARLRKYFEIIKDNAINLFNGLWTYKKYIFVLILYILLNQVLNSFVTDSNNKIIDTLNDNFKNKYIENNNKPDFLEKLVRKLSDESLKSASEDMPGDTIANTVIMGIRTELQEYFIRNLRSAYNNSPNRITSDDSSLIIEYQEHLWKFIQFNDGKEFNEIVFKINKLLEENKLPTTDINKKQLLTYESNAGATTIDNQVKVKLYNKINDILDTIVKIRNHCSKLRNDNEIYTTINGLTRKLTIFSIIIVVFVLYLLLHPLIKNGGKYVLNYLIFIIIIFVVLMSLYGWASGFTYL